MWNGIFAIVYFCGLVIFFVLRKLIFATRTHWLFSLIINFCDFQKVLSTFPASRGPSWRGKNERKNERTLLAGNQYDNIFILVKYLQSGCNRNTYSQTATAMGTLCKSSNSLYTVLFLNERGRLWLNRHDFLVLYFCVANLSREKFFSLLSVVFL